ncbi:NlpBDapX family lipoprotein, partial [gut metagenome]
TGYIETNWAENKAKLPQDIIRSTIGKAFDFVYSTGERDQYRCRLERNGDGTTDVFVTHRSMVEVYTGSDKETTMWQPGPADPTLEAEMLQRLALAIDEEFNPEFEPLKKEEVAKTMDVTKVEALSTVVKNQDGQIEAILVNEPFDRAWRTVNLVIDRMGFELVDRDRTEGYFRVRYLDPAYEMKVKESRGFLSNMFGGDEKIEAPEYRIQLDGEGMKTRLVVLNGEGEADETGSAGTILTLLGEQLR